MYRSVWVKHGFTSTLPPRTVLNICLEDLIGQEIFFCMCQWNHTIHIWLTNKEMLHSWNEILSTPVKMRRETKTFLTRIESFQNRKLTHKERVEFMLFPHSHNSFGNKWHRLALVPQGTWMSNTADLYD